MARTAGEGGADSASMPHRLPPSRPVMYALSAPHWWPRDEEGRNASFPGPLMLLLLLLRPGRAAEPKSLLTERSTRSTRSCQRDKPAVNNESG